MKPVTNRLAVIGIRDGVLPAGANEAITQADGNALVLGGAVSRTISEVSDCAQSVICAEVGVFAPAAWAKALAKMLADTMAEVECVVLPASPDGRDLAPRLAAELGWPLVTGAVKLEGVEVQVGRHGGLVLETMTLSGPAVVTIVPGATQARPSGNDVEITEIELVVELASRLDTESLGVTEADAQSLDLSEARRIIAGGAGLQSEAAFVELAELGASIQASVGGTRVVMDKGWIPFDRQIGTTGIMVNPDLYISLGISGAVQHTAGLGEPDHIIAVNTDPHCPMMAMADLALVTDAPMFLTELLALTKEL